MSTGPLDPADRPDPPVSPALVATIGGLAALLVIGIIAVVLNSDGSSDVVIDGQLTATPVTSASATGDPAGTPTPTPTPTATPTPTPTPTPTGPREPTDTDGGAFAEDSTPPGATDARTVLADLDGDDRNEVVLVVRLGGSSLLQVGVWDGNAYDNVLTDEGGTAEEIVDIAVRDVNRSPSSKEIVVRQRNGTEGESISLWGVVDGVYEPLEAVGGCWDESHTYGITGATIDVEEGEIIATCDGSPEPTVAFPSDIYRWDDAEQAFVYVETRSPAQATPTPTATPNATVSPSPGDDGTDAN